ncbi:glucose-6-phosphate dehydrogenase assembly protein OpcA [Bifidobacterium favimelis]|uniref:Glucose-6-phosphate dehydrogenase assembly protein OpcA n=1 Tax=Bifidobacterium favimelis TaxID=3122979 RepID=A0ABU8ZQ73_9BIFI
MIVTMPDTTTSALADEIDELHVERGEAATGRVLTLVIITRSAHLEGALETVNTACREHPCRVIAIVTDQGDYPGPGEDEDGNRAGGQDGGPGRPGQPDGGHGREDAPGDGCSCSKRTEHAGSHTLDAEIRSGSDAGAGEIVVLRPVPDLLRHSDALVIPLLVPDAPLVAWWPADIPEDVSADRVGTMAVSRITDVMHAEDPQAAFDRVLAHPSPQDVDLSWTRTTVWRSMLASMLDQPPHLPIRSVRVTGQAHYLPLELLASWLAMKLGVPVQVERKEGAQAITGVFFEREDGTLGMERERGDQAVISQPGQADQGVSLPLRTDVDCMNEELGRLDPDEVYGEVITRGWPLVDHD